ncbi:hypothetical protein ABH313_09675, partial [Chromobacterium vaccinii]|uniref:hypothetical protein n=1 Tax=Chromobacterium vaccinii TaxID=1108595 RepID=UPI0032607E4B
MTTPPWLHRSIASWDLGRDPVPAEMERRQLARTEMSVTVDGSPQLAAGRDVVDHGALLQRFHGAGVLHGLC